MTNVLSSTQNLPVNYKGTHTDGGSMEEFIVNRG